MRIFNYQKGTVVTKNNFAGVPAYSFNVIDIGQTKPIGPASGDIK